MREREREKEAHEEVGGETDRADMIREVHQLVALLVKK